MARHRERDLNCQNSLFLLLWLRSSRIIHRSLTLLIGFLLLSESVAAIPVRRSASIVQQPASVSQEATRTAAERAYQEAVKLYKQGTAESLRRAIAKFEEALSLDRARGDRRSEAVTLNKIGQVYNDLGQKQKALEFYNQSLPLTREVGDKTGEAITLNNIGAVYSDLGQKQKALEFYNQSLPLSREVENKSQEAFCLYNIAFLERNKGNLKIALTQIEASINIIEDLRTKITTQQLRTSYFATVQNYYKFYIDLLMRLHKTNPSQGYDALALNASERARARSLLEILTEARANIRHQLRITQTCRN